MAKQRGFILKELMLYLFLGSLLLVSVLQLFKMSWLAFSSIRRINEVSNDFINVSERLKYDLLSDIEGITIGKTSFTFTFLEFTSDHKTFVTKEYTLMMKDSRLVYNIYASSGYTAIYLSSLVQRVQFETREDLFTIVFDYGDYQFRRSFRLDHIQTQRLLFRFLYPADDLSRHFGGGRVHGPGPGSHPKLHILV